MVITIIATIDHIAMLDQSGPSMIMIITTTDMLITTIGMVRVGCSTILAT